MANRIALACYSIRFRTKHKRDVLALDSRELEGLHDFFKDYFTGLTQTRVDDEEAKKVLTASHIAGSHPSLKGTLKTGDYGYEADLVDVKGSSPTYRRKKEQAQMLPFFFRLYLPPTGEMGVLILQRFGLFGVRSILYHDFAPKFSERFPDLSFNLYPQVPDGVLEELMNSGGLKAITLRKLSLPNDIADSIHARPESGVVDVVIRAVDGNTFQRALSGFKRFVNDQSATGITEIEFGDFKYDKILLKIEIGKVKKTVDLSDLYKLRAVMDVSEEVIIGPDGHPTFNSISRVAEELLDGICRSLRI